GLDEAHQDVVRRQVGGQADVGGRWAGLGVRVRVVVADHVEAEIVDFVVDAQLVAWVHVVVDRLAACRRYASLSVSKHSAVSRDRVGGVVHPEHSRNLAVASSKDAADFVGIALSGVGDQFLAQGLGEFEALYHQTLPRTVSRASSSDWLQTPRL